MEAAITTSAVKKAKHTQNFGHDPVEVRDTDHYQQEYVEGFVDKWDELIDWDARYKSEGDFFIKLLKERGAKRVLDVATGTGFHSVRLIEAGFEVCSVDGSAAMLAKAFENGKRRGHILRTIQADWRWLNQDVHAAYDAVICLGNSFNHLFDERDRRKALAEFYAVLKHDGCLILDQRNYDAILDEGFSTKHKYYYCGHQVSAEPEHVDEGLARFRYTFPDDSVYYLNMCPIRRDYTRRLMQEVGFQKISTYSDFEDEESTGSPDFYIHVAEKKYRVGGDDSDQQAILEPTDQGAAKPATARATATDTNQRRYSDAVETAREYYNSSDADHFYFHIWGGEDIHIGLYQPDDEPIAEASRRTVRHMADLLENESIDLDENTRVLDLGAGYGGSMRHLARRFGCHCVALNLSEVENMRDREINREQGLDQLIDVVDGDFTSLPYEDSSFDVIWSQDALLHSGDREKVLAEAVRVLKPGGRLIFTDPMQSDDAPVEQLQPIYDRIHLDSLGSPGFYRQTLQRLGLEQVTFEDHTQQLSRHYSRVRQELVNNRSELLDKGVSRNYIKRMQDGLQHWVEGGGKSYLAWGIFLFRKT